MKRKKDICAESEQSDFRMKLVDYAETELSAN